MICSRISCENNNELRNGNDQIGNDWSSSSPPPYLSSSTTVTPVNVFEAEVINGTIADRTSSEAVSNEASLADAEVTIEESLSTTSTTTEAVPTTSTTAAALLKNLSNENMPSFSEWTQKRLEEKARKLQNSSEMKPNSSNANQVVRKTKLKAMNWKNYASPTCGAKVLDANNESGNPNHIITASKDEYCLNKCKNAIWFIIELCEAIQIQVFELANFELYSSSPHEFELAISDRYQPKEWTILGNFSARNDHEMQQFRTDSLLFSKYVRFVVRSHHGNEHYCTISHVRLFGISEIEALKKQDDDDDSNEDDDDDDETIRRQSAVVTDHNDTSHLKDERTTAIRFNNSIFNSAKMVVNSVVEKVKEVLGVRPQSEQVEQKNLVRPKFRTRLCQTPKYRIEVEPDDPKFLPVLEQISCNYHRYHNSHNIRLDRFLNSSCSQSYSSVFDVFVVDPITVQTVCYWHRVSKNEAVINDTAIKLFDVLVAMDAVDPKFVQNKDQTNNGVVGSGGGNAIAVDGTGFVTGGDSHATASDHFGGQQSGLEPIGGVAESNTNQNLGSLTSESTADNLTVAGDISTTTADGFSSQVHFSRVIDVFDVYRGHVQRNRESTPVCTRNAHVTNKSTAPNPTVATSATTGASAGSNTTNGRSSGQPQQQQESVFLRLSNRIKILEQNLSLSSQYLEELSQRYKKQVEDMQRHFDETLGSLRDKLSECDRSDESIRNRLFGLARQMTAINERTVIGWPQTLAFYAKLIVSELIVTAICLCLFRRHWNRQNRLAAAANTTIEVIPEKGQIINYSRRKSVDAIPNAGMTTLSLASDTKTHQRRSSHEPQLISTMPPPPPTTTTTTTTTTTRSVDEFDSRSLPLSTQPLSKAAEKRRRRKLLKRNQFDQQQRQQQKHHQRLEERHEFEIDADTLKVFVDDRPASSSSSQSSPSSYNNENAVDTATATETTMHLAIGNANVLPLLERDKNCATTKTSSFKVKTTALAAAAAAHVSAHKRNKKKNGNGFGDGSKKDGTKSSKTVSIETSSASTTTTSSSSGLMKFFRKVF